MLVSIHLGASIRTPVGRFWARCIMASDDDEVALLSKGRPRRAKPLGAVAGTRDQAMGHATTQVNSVEPG